MNHAKNQQVDLHWNEGKDLPALLREAADIIENNPSMYSEVHTHLDYETGDYALNVYIYS